MPLSIGKSGSSKISTKNSFKIDGTVHSHHKEKMEQFAKMREELPKKRNEFWKIKAELERLQISKDENFIKIKDLEQQVLTIEQEVATIESNQKEHKYFLDVGPLLCKYYDYSIQDQCNSSLETKQKWLSRKYRPQRTVDSPSPKNKKTRYRPKRLKPIRTTKVNQMGKREMLDEYKSITDPNYVKKSESKNKKEESICEDCQVPKILQYRESKFICPKCGVEETTFIDSDRPSFKDPPPEANYFAYKRINHFNELLAQFQAKESTHIPKEVFDMIRMELKKNRLTVKDLDYERVKGYLKKHSDQKYNQHYDHIFHIINRLNGDKPLNMTPEMESNLRFLFLQIQEPFNKYCPEDRKNFISYNFVFYKFCQMLGYREFLKYFPLLKSKDKLYEQEKIWQKIMIEIGLPYK